MVTLRLWHSYLGVLIAPSVLFFSLTGAVQLFSLHEDHGGYHAPVLLERLASLHKDQVLKVHEHHSPGSAPAEDAAAAEPPHDANAGAVESAPSSTEAEHDRPVALTLLLKSFF